MKSRVAHRRLQAIEEISGPIALGARILDLGCGKGGTVKELRALGYDAYGFDVYPTYGGVDYRQDPAVKDLHEQGILKYVTLDDYGAPFEDDSFDVVLSDEVFEHVADYDLVLREIHRVMKPGGRSLNLFPSRYRLIEPHCYVPLACVMQDYWWLRIWAALGVRNEFQRGLSATEAARRNEKALRTGTHYLSRRQITRHVEGVFGNCAFEELAVLKHSGLGRYYPFIRVLPFAGPIISAMRSRALYFEKRADARSVEGAGRPQIQEERSAAG